jgi:hypothetical protein
MRFLQHTREEQRIPGNGAGGPSAASLEKYRSEAERLLAAGDEAIRRALSSADSQAFLNASRQQGGE